jgi:ketosteroid isomerase-like protein
MPAHLGKRPFEDEAKVEVEATAVLRPLTVKRSVVPGHADQPPADYTRFTRGKALPMHPRTTTAPAAAGTTFRSALDEHLGALQARDVARFAATLGEDAVVVDGGGKMKRGAGAVLQSHAEWFALPVPWRFDYDVVFTRETSSSGLALLKVSYTHEPGADPVRFLLSLVFERDQDGTFKFVYDQNTPLE